MAIYLYIIRHGEAEPIAAEDELRELTEHGRWEAKRTALWLKTQLSQFQHVFVSPYVRAQQTKDIIIEQGPDALDIEVLNHLTPDGNAKIAMDYVLANVDAAFNNEISDDFNIACVSHMPLVSYLIGELTGYTPIMTTAGVAKIKVDLDKWQGQLDALLSPDQML
jgi:phosphohistidine phosphatase